jgi:hypothetical protein
MITEIFPPVIWWEHNGDEVCWNGKYYVSLMFNGYFDTLEELDIFWKEYEEACKKD